MRGLVFDIQRFSVGDGPGIRSTVFLKGCNLSCRWCHNPESARSEPEIRFYPDLCIDCGACMRVCPGGAIRPHQFDRELCSGCGTCAQACFSAARVLTGREMTPSQVLDEVLKDAAFYKNSGGGMTVSGGEPMLQVDFLEELLREAKKAGLHTAVDTAGCVDFSGFARILPYADLFLYDVKAESAALHRQWTGADNRQVFQNLSRLAAEKARIWVRIPVIPGFNNTIHEIGAIGRAILEAGSAERVELKNYHRMGAEKYISLGRKCLMPDEARPLENQEMERYASCLRDLGLNVC